MMIIDDVGDRYKRTVPDIRSITVNLDHNHISNRLAVHAKEKGPVTGGCPISSMVMVKMYGNGTYIGNCPPVLMIN